MTIIKSYSIINRWATIIMAFFIIVILYVVIWSLDKGFDLADEGLHLAYSNPNVVNNNSLFNYDLFFKSLYKFVDFEFDIVSLRFAKFLLLILIFILGLPLFRRFKFSTLDKFFLGIAVFSSYTFLTLSLSYNTICLLIILFYIYVYVNINDASVIKQNLLWVVLSILSSLCFFVKPPVSLLLLGISLVLSIISFPKFNLKSVSLRLLFILLGYSVVQFGFQIVFPDYIFMKVLKNGGEISSYYESYSKISLIKRILVSFKWVLILNTTGWFFSYLLNQTKFHLLKNIISLAIIVLTLLYFFSSHYSSNEFDSFQYGLIILSCIAIGSFIYFQKISNYTRENWILLFLLFMAPFICSFGSNVYFFRTGQQYLFFWILLLVYFKNSSDTIPKHFILIWYFIFASFISLKIYNNIVVNPDNQPKLMTCSFKYKYADDKFIFLEKNQAIYLENLKKKLNYWSPNRKEIIGLYAMPGDIILAGFTNYYNPLIWDNSQWEFLKNKIKLDTKYAKKSMPILISKAIDYKTKSRIENFKLVDSVKYYKDGYIYIFKKG